jgi:hypothetical protein
MAESEINPGLVSKDRNQNAAANPIYVQLTDGTAVLSVTGGVLDVNANVTFDAQYQVDDAAGATDFGLNVLVVRDDALTTLTPVDGDYVSLRVGSTGALWTTFTNTTIAVTQSGTWVLGANSGVDIGDVTINNGAGAAAVNIQDGGNSITVDGTVSISGSVTVTASQLDIDDLNLTDDAVRVSGNSSPNSETNPIFVQVVEQAASGNEVHVSDTETNLAVDTEANHDYTAVGTFHCTMVTFSATGAARAEVINDATGTPVTVRIAHLNGRQGDYKEIRFIPALEVAAGDVLRVRVKNRQGAANDVHSSISGWDV